MKASAQSIPHTPEISITENYKGTEIQNASDSIKKISGYVRDVEGRPLAGASIFIPGTNAGTSSDMDGKFELKIPPGSSSLTISSVGYAVSRVNINEAVSDIVLVKMYQNVMGEIVVVKTRKVKKHKPVKPTEELNKILIYPNPVNISSKLNISWDKAVSEVQMTEIFDASGKFIQKEIIQPNGKTALEKITLKLSQPGMYVIKITDSKTNKYQSFNFIAN